ncbi:MAG: ABC transporter permease [Planctomycetes bacterium]|nr:ABC transporter permease [Planctomycetota bacterium]
MRNQLLPLLRNEIVKATRRRLPYFGLLMGALICVLTYVVMAEIGAADTANAWGYVALSMQLVFADIALIFVLVFAAMLMSDETRSGTIRAALAAPLSRWEFFVAKAVTGLLYMVVMSCVSLLLSALLARARYRFGAVGDSLGEIYSLKTVLTNFLLAWVLSWIPLAAVVFYGLFLSTVVRSSGAAVAVSIGTLYVIEFTKHLVGLDPYLFTRYLTYPWQIVGQLAQGVGYQWQPEVWRMLALCGVSGAVAFAAGLILFLRQDLNE